ncbi:MAG: alpha/beta hydrolase [Actinomyces sp.]|nr:MAG: alpha/beta hydrolase [Actinomyces sp.]
MSDTTATPDITPEIDYGVTRDGLLQLRRRWRPATPARAAVLVLHGIAEHSGRYEHVGGRLAAHGFDVVAIDQRGYGRSGGRRGHVDSWDQFLDDVEDQMAQVRSLDLPVVLLGHSMGGLIATSYVTDERPAPDLLVLSGPALGADVPWHLRVAAPLLGTLWPTLVIRDEGDPSVLATDPAVGERFYADPLRVPYPTARLGRELLRAIAKARSRIDRVTMPTLVVHGGDDTLVPTEASAILEDLPNVTRRVYPGLRHEVFNEPVGLDIVDEVAAWIDERLAEL